MPNQEIGVKSLWDTKQFSRGLNTYLKGLTNAIAATNNAVAAINNLGSTAASVFAATATHSKTLVAALQAITTAAKAAAAATARANQGRGSPRVQVVNVNNPASNTTVQQINATANATRNLNTQAQKATGSLQTLNTKSIAVGVAIGTVAGNAIGAFARSLTIFGGKVLEIVTFFERLDLSIGFFAARSFQAADATISFDEALALGAKEAQGLSIWLQRLAVASPFTTRDVGILFRTAQAYGLTRKEAEKLTPLLLDFAAAAGLDEDILQRLALAMGQVRARGKLTGEEVRQLGNSGIPIRDILVKALGIANEEFDELLESGAFTSDIVIPAVIDALKDFEGAGERVAFGTIGGIISAFKELQEIGIAKFFLGVLGPLKKSFQDLFAVLNQPKVLAFITVLGQEIGDKLRATIFGVIGAIRGWIAAWRALDPVMQQQVIVFGAATIGVLALTAAFGLLTVAVGLLLSPVSLITLTVGFLVSEWTSGFAVLRGIVTRAASGVGSALGDIVSGLRTAGTAIGNFFVGIGRFFGELAISFANYGKGAMEAFAAGMRGGSSAITAVIRGIGNILTFWLAPGSPPNITPDIDEWGEADMEEYVKAFGNANVKKALGNGLTIVSDSITQEFIDAQQEGIDRFNAAFEKLHPGQKAPNSSIVTAMREGIKKGMDETKKEVANSSDVEGEAAEAGIRVSESFVDGFLSRIPSLTPKVSKELQDVLNAIGGGQQLSRLGALSFGKFLDGFGEADFGVLEETSDIVQEFLQGLVDAGQIEEVDVPRLLFGAREDLAQGIKDIEEVGHVTTQTMQRIRATAGGASKFVIQLLESYAPLSAATDAAKEAQDRLTAVTEKYKAILTPLRKELEAIQEVNKVADEDEKVLSLRRLIANQAVSDRRRTNAQNQITQIFAERKVRGLEKERDAATEVAEEELKAREKTRDMLEQQFNDLQRNIQAQLSQLGLFNQEAGIIRKLREEAEKLREKEMTQEELHLKFLELQGEELSDLIEAARAKHTLEDATSSVLEKEAAQITLAEVALRRRNREAEAIKLGIPVEELTKLRDFEVTLDDIGVKVKDTFEFDGTDGALSDSLVDAAAITKEWEETLQKVRDRWQEIKDEIEATARAIDANLPSFLKIFPEEPGGEPPIIGFIKNYTGAIIALIAVIQGLKVVSTIAGLITVITNLATLGTIGGAAAAGGGAAAAGGGVALTGAAAIIAAVTSSLIAFTVVSGGFVAAALAVGKAIEGMNKHAVGRTIIGTASPLPLPEVAPGTPADETIEKSFGGNFFSNPFDPAIEKAAGNKTKLVEAYTLLPDEAQPVRDSITTLLSGFADDEQQRTFAESITSLVTTGVATGLSDAQISNQVSGAFNSGVAAGLIADTEANRVTIAAYATELLALIRSQFQIKSPSALTEAEIGVPLGQGILKGISLALSEGSKELVSTSDILWGDLKKSFTTGKNTLVGIAEALRVALNTKMTNIKTSLKTLLESIVQEQNAGWTQVRTDGERETEALRVSTGLKFEALRATLFTKMAEIKAVVVNAFKSMRTESETEVTELRKSVVNMLAGEEGSLLTDLNAAFLGLDQVVPKNIGKLFIEGIALGITENRQTLADAMVDALQYALLTSAQTELGIKSPSSVAAAKIGLPYAQGIAKGIMDGMGTVTGASRAASMMAIQAPLEARFGGGSAGQISSATSTSITRNNHYHLNVRSAAQSQGVVNDFGIMQTMRSRK